jgi:hypothetical protein
MIKTSPCNPLWISAGYTKPAGYCAALPVDWERVSKTPSIVREADQMKPSLSQAHTMTSYGLWIHHVACFHPGIRVSGSTQKAKVPAKHHWPPHTSPSRGWLSAPWPSARLPRTAARRAGPAAGEQNDPPGRESNRGPTPHTAAPHVAGRRSGWARPDPWAPTGDRRSRDPSRRHGIRVGPRSESVADAVPGIPCRPDSGGAGAGSPSRHRDALRPRSRRALRRFAPRDRFESGPRVPARGRRAAAAPGRRRAGARAGIHRRAGPGRSESIRVDASRSEWIRVDASGCESIRVDPSRSESIRVDPSRSESIRVDASRSESMRIRQSS